MDAAPPELASKQIDNNRMKKTSTSTCRALAATSKFRFAGLGILLALAVNAQASMTLNLDLSFDQASISGMVDGSGIPGTATGTFTLTGGFVATSTGDVYGGGYLFGVGWSNIVSSPLPDNAYLEFSMVPASGTVTCNGVAYAPTSIGTTIMVDPGMGNYFAFNVNGNVAVPTGELAALSLAGTFTVKNWSPEMGADLVSGSFDNYGSGGTFEVTSDITAVPEPASTLSLGGLLASAMFLRTRRRINGA